MAIALDSRPMRDVTAWNQLKTNRNWLAIWFMLPAAAFLILFLAYPLGLGVWLSFTDARLGRDGIFVGFENYEYLWEDSIFWLSVFNTLLYTSRRQHHKIRRWALSRTAVERETSVQGDHTRGRSDPLHRADRAVGNSVLVVYSIRNSRSSRGHSRKWA